MAVHTGVWKAPVRGRRMVRRLNVDGDGQGGMAEGRKDLFYPYGKT